MLLAQKIHLLQVILDLIELIQLLVLVVPWNLVLVYLRIQELLVMILQQELPLFHIIRDGIIVILITSIEVKKLKNLYQESKTVFIT